VFASDGGEGGRGVQVHCAVRGGGLVRDRRGMAGVEVEKIGLALGILSPRERDFGRVWDNSDSARPSVRARLRCLRRLLHPALVLLGLGFRRGAAGPLGPYRFRHCNCWRFSYHVHAAESPRCRCCSRCCSCSGSWRRYLASVVVVSATERRGDEISASEVYLPSEEASRMAMSEVKEEHEFYIVCVSSRFVVALTFR
jgi:hypothetical protein